MLLVLSLHVPLLFFFRDLDQVVLRYCEPSWVTPFTFFARFAGAIGSSIATPTDLVKVRMQAQGKLRDGETKRYKSTFAAFREIFREGGLKGLYVGVGPTVKRAAILTATQVNIS